MQASQVLQARDIERLARRRAAMKLGWTIHAFFYVVVNLMLAVLSGMSERHWAVFPALGWGLGLAIHGVVVFLVSGGGGIYERLLQNERHKLQRDPW